MDALTESTPRIEHNYLREQFADADAIWAKIKSVVERGDYTLGRELVELETAWAKACEVNHAIGVNSGTDALILSLKAANIHGEVIVPAFGFIATAAAIHLAGAKIVFCDVDEDFNIDAEDAARRITPHTAAIMVVHWAGNPVNWRAVSSIANQHGVYVFEDCAHAVGSRWLSYPCGSLGETGSFSLHPLKNVNVWGDGGVITTNNTVLAEKIRRWRNHGLVDRNTCEHWGHNSRLDTVQAVVAAHILDKMTMAMSRRVRNARELSERLDGIDDILLPTPRTHAAANWYLYSIRVRQNRDQLCTFLNSHGVDAKVHYPTPLPYQQAAAKLGHKRGDFPGAERACAETLSLPVHEFIAPEQIDKMGDLVQSFYSTRWY